MKFTAPKKELSAALKLAMNCAERRATIPILGHLLVEAGHDGLSITASDLDCEVHIKAPAKVEIPGRLAIDGPIFSDMAARAGGEDIAVSYEKDRIVASSGRSRFSIPTLPADDFPLLKMPGNAACFPLLGGEFQKATALVAHAVSTEETRYYLCGIYVHPFKGLWRCVSTDGHRMALAEFTAPAHGESLTPFILPPKSAALAGKLFPNGEDLAFECSPALVSLSGERASLISKLVDGNYPDYQRIVPMPKQTVTFQGADLKTAIERLSATDSGAGIKFCFEGETLYLSSRKDMTADGSDEIDISPSKPFEASYNPRYILDALGMFGDGEVGIGLDAHDGPVVLRCANESQLTVVMPFKGPPKS